MSVAANGQAARLPCGDDCRLAALMADIWFGLDTGQDPRWRMMRSRPAPSPVITARRCSSGARSRALMVLVLRTGTSDATDSGAGVFLDVVDDLDRPGLFEHQRALDLLAEL